MLQLSKDLAHATVLTNHDANEEAFTSRNLSTREEKRRRDVMRALLVGLEILILSVFLLLSRFTVVRGVLLELVGFTCHCGLVALDTRAANDDAVDGDVHTCADLQNVTHHDVVMVDRLLMTVSDGNNLYSSTVRVIVIRREDFKNA